MRLNESTLVVGQHVCLVPYLREHVATYHQWMGDPELLEATASERQSLESEMENQQSWHANPDILTFIIIDKAQMLATPVAKRTVTSGMIGDINAFIQPDRRFEAELSVMIAEPTARRKGFARDAVLTFLRYCIEHLRISHIKAIVDDSNPASLRFFEKLHFRRAAYTRAFQSWTLERVISERLCHSDGTPLEAGEPPSDGDAPEEEEEDAFAFIQVSASVNEGEEDTPTGPPCGTPLCPEPETSEAIAAWREEVLLAETARHFLVAPVDQWIRDN
ncbi:hypothetical protein H696_04641 [Fonticula alba]|uniref:N-acetyltransferase domain-containing protein n=1 Tax=Fonticula alba TaxID=691883 RepID=A0A058Z4K8_FONAL|nr:hypothetical protein H696_04641 [Fonticula alba]KCV69224.1 hypothetical protein H696_04641 [Fonticula alba]|eukprot:XP_009496795.1 hypothetical protein H696_04641 [Fonticula alba]